MLSPLDIKKDGFVIALQADVKTVYGLAVALAAFCDQGFAAFFPLNQIDHRVGGVCLGLVVEI